MPQQHLIRRACTQCKRIINWTRKNRKQVERKLEHKKYCRWCKKHVMLKELKK